MESSSGRLSMQVGLSLGFLALAALAAFVPVKALQPIKHAVAWTVNHDENLAARAVAVRRWAADQGGWLVAANQIWQAGQNRLTNWVDPFISRFKGSAPTVAHSGNRSDATVLPVDGALLQPFGWTSYNGVERLHEGADLLAAEGDPVYSMTDGTVVRVGRAQEQGNFVEVDHGICRALYGQLATIQVKQGQRVQRGQTLARVGRPVGSERVLAPHLHVEIRPAGSRNLVDPASYLGVGGGSL